MQTTQRTNSSLRTQQPANAATCSALPAAAGLPLHWCFAIWHTGALSCAIAARCAIVITRPAADDIVCVRPFILLKPKAKASTRTPPKLWGYRQHSANLTHTEGPISAPVTARAYPARRDRGDRGDTAQSALIGHVNPIIFLFLCRKKRILPFLLEHFSLSKRNYGN